MKDIKDVIAKMKSLSIDANYEQYMELIDACEEFENKYVVLRIITGAPGASSIKLSLIFSLVSKLKAQYDNKLVHDVLEYVRSIPGLSTDDYEWIAKIVFVIIENIRDKKRNDEIKLLVMENLQRCSQKIDIMNYLFNFMLNENCGEIVYALLVFIPEICDSFVRNAMHQTNVNILKNVAQVFSTLSGQYRSLFVNYKHFEAFLDSEHYFLRNCYLDIVSNLVELFKEVNNIEEIVNIVGILEERLKDVYFNVRYKAINLLGSLFESNSIPMNVRNSVISAIGERVLDKTIIVRKRALSVCSTILMNHPFKTESSLRRINIKDEGCDKQKYYEDLNNFHDVMKDVLDKVVLYLGSKSTNDLYVFIEFIKLSLYYEIEGAREAFELIFDFVFENEGEAIAICFSDIIVRLRMRKVGPYDLLKQFVTKKGNPAFEKILRELWRRKVVDHDFHQELVTKFLTEEHTPSFYEDLYVASYLIRFLPKVLDEERYKQILRHSTNVLFKVKDSAELDEALSIYCNVLKMPFSKSSDDCESLIIKNLAKMVFFDYKTVQFTVQAVSEKNLVELLKMLTLKNVNSLKIIYSVGCISMRYLKYLEKLERISKSNKDRTRMDSIVPEDIKERRKSINASRMSIQSVMLDENDFAQNKTDDELADFFFYIKEKDVLYNPESLLFPYARDILSLCLSEDEAIQEVAYLSLFKMMCLSSEYFQEHKKLLRDAFVNKNTRIRANAVVAMGDFLLYYNSLVEDLTPLLFESLLDVDIVVKKNAILTIFNLLKRNILRVSGCSIHLSRLIYDEDTEISNITKTIISSLSDNENFITTLLYERLTTEKEEFKSFVDLFVPFLKDKSKEMIFLKLLRANLDPDVLKYIFTKFNFNEKFSEDLKLIEEFKVLEIKA